MKRLATAVVLLYYWPTFTSAAQPTANSSTSIGLVTGGHNSLLTSIDRTAFSNVSSSNRDKDCECFNCLLPKFTCGQYGECSEFDGQCKCPPGWSGLDCLTPQCGSLADGRERLPRPDGEGCECSEGWGGLNCNVCLTNEGCAQFPFANLTDDEISRANMTCYREGETVLENHQMCDVTNKKILDMLEDRLPQVTFSCNIESDTCLFQFWIGKVESFYCQLDTCKIGASRSSSKGELTYECEHLRCSCIKDRMLCGEAGSVDIGDFLYQEIKGPAKFSCAGPAGCKFEEAAMNELITSVFGDPYITLKCQGGECLPERLVPGYVTPPKPDNTATMAISVAGAAAVFILTFVGLWYVGRARSESFGAIQLPDDEHAKLLANHVPASLQFKDISYRLGDRLILDKISGTVHSGEVLAIMGASGAGKSTFLDILARKNKRGTVSGTMLVNGQNVGDADFRDAIGFVDQEDTLMGTLTVYETVLYSALLRLPREMSFDAKKFRTMETLHELGLLGIKDSRIGDASRRSISGGEKRRVSIACELVTSPSILFLDEPTSGLDSFNALNVVECLVSMATQYNRTVVFTIHQPRSNIVSLFHNLIVLAEGKLVYSGSASKCHEYFESIGQPCPAGFNIADYLIDITMTAKSAPAIPPNEALLADHLRPDVERAIGTSSSGSQGDATELHTRPNSLASDAASPKPRTSQTFNISKTNGTGELDIKVSPEVQTLVDAYAMSGICAAIEAEISDVERHSSVHPHGPTIKASSIRGHRRASWSTQFRILSGRAFKNMYRDPALLGAHYAASIIVAVICGLFFRNVGNDIAGFQNRLGLFFFTLALFGFSCLSSLGLFANERILFIRERSNGYYSTFTYFSSKVLFDILPLRVIPPLVYGGIIYGLVGLLPTAGAFWRFMLTLVLFNLTTASVVLVISVAFASTGVATLVGTLIMLYNLLFAGLLINADTVPPSLRWLHKVSFFHAAFEALAVNELRTLQLTEIKYGIEIDIPSASILQVFGLKALAFWWPDIATLTIFFASFTATSFILLQFYVRERR